MKIIVTGANGYLGQGIVKALLDRGAEVTAADITAEHIDKRAECLAFDLFSVENPVEMLGNADCLLHLAWRNGFVHQSDTHLEDLSKHYQFIKKMAESKISQIAVMGTMHEIGFWEGSVDEETPCRPMNLYGISKNALREAAELCCKTNHVVFQWLRGFYIVGNSSFGSSIFSKITEAEQNGLKEFPFTTGQNQYDFLDYEVFCSQTAAAVMQNKINGIINICSGRPEKLADRVERFISENHYHISLNYGAFPDRAYDSKAVWGNSEKIDRIMKKEYSS